MRILLAMTVFAIACGSPPKKQSAIVNEGEVSPTCCCKTLPTTAEKEIIPVYAMTGRMECSGARGDCVDDVQCAGQESGTDQAQPTDEGVPPPPALEPSTDADGI